MNVSHTSSDAFNIDCMRIVRISIAVTVAAWVTCTGAATPPSCDSPLHRQFDFWLGEWEVHTVDGKLAGINRIEREYDGCVIHEKYAGTRGFKGESLNTYDAARKVWHQTWVDNQGTLLVLEGGLRGEEMVLEGQAIATDGQRTRHRITWSPVANGSVRQHWESTDEKNPWITVFDGRYTRKTTRKK